MKKKKKATLSLIIKSVVFLILFYFWFGHLGAAIQNQNLKGFDPYEILSIEHGATDKEVRKAYRNMAKIYHPDVNPGDPNNQKYFILISKAYKCLKDEESRANC